MKGDPQRPLDDRNFFHQNFDKVQSGSDDTALVPLEPLARDPPTTTAAAESALTVLASGAWPFSNDIDRSIEMHVYDRSRTAPSILVPNHGLDSPGLLVLVH